MAAFCFCWWDTKRKSGAPKSCPSIKMMVRPGFEPGTFCVLDRCDNQLRHRTVLMARKFVQTTGHLTKLFLYCNGHLRPLGMSFYFIRWNRAFEHEKVINKAGGLVYQRNFAGVSKLLRLLRIFARLVQSSSQMVSHNSPLTNTSSLRARCTVYTLSRADSPRQARAPARTSLRQRRLK